MYLILSLIFTILILYLYVSRKNQIETYVNPTVSYFKIKVGVCKTPDFDYNYKFLSLLSEQIPIQIIQFDNKYEPYYELKRRNVDLVLGSEKDYMIYYINQRKRKNRTFDAFRKIPQIQMITALYHVYFLLIADYDKIIQYSDINDAKVQLSPKEDLGLDVEYDLFQNYKVHFKHRSKDIKKAFSDLTKDSSILVYPSIHPNKIFLEQSNQKELYLLDAVKLNNNSEFFNKYLFMNKTNIDLKYYPKVLQRTTSNEIGYKLNTYSTRMLLLGLDVINETYIYEFMKALYSKIDDIREKYPYFNNFKNSEISYSRLSLQNRVLSIHNGAIDFYKRIGNITNNPALGCALIANECTDEQLSQFGDFLS